MHHGTSNHCFEIWERRHHVFLKQVISGYHPTSDDSAGIFPGGMCPHLFHLHGRSPYLPNAVKGVVVANEYLVDLSSCPNGCPLPELVFPDPTSALSIQHAPRVPRSPMRSMAHPFNITPPPARVPSQRKRVNLRNESTTSMTRSPKLQPLFDDQHHDAN